MERRISERERGITRPRQPTHQFREPSQNDLNRYCRYYNEARSSGSIAEANMWGGMAVLEKKKLISETMGLPAPTQTVIPWDAQVDPTEIPFISDDDPPPPPQPQM